jgi:hypothetical protein
LNNSISLSKQILLSQRVSHDVTYGSNRLVGSYERVDIKTDHHALVAYDPAFTEHPIDSYVLFTPSVGTSDKLLPRHTSTYVHNLRPFNYDPARTSPLAIAQQNE